MGYGKDKEGTDMEFAINYLTKLEYLDRFIDVGKMLFLTTRTYDNRVRHDDDVFEARLVFNKDYADFCEVSGFLWYHHLRQMRQMVFECNYNGITFRYIMEYDPEYRDTIKLHKYSIQDEIS